MIPRWSDRHPSKRGKKIYSEAYVAALIAGSLISLVPFVLFSSLAIRLGWPDLTRKENAKSVQTRLFIAEIERRLTAATS